MSALEPNTSVDAGDGYDHILLWLTMTRVGDFTPLLSLHIRHDT